MFIGTSALVLILGFAYRELRLAFFGGKTSQAAGRGKHSPRRSSYPKRTSKSTPRSTRKREGHERLRVDDEDLDSSDEGNV